MKVVITQQMWWQVRHIPWHKRDVALWDIVTDNLTWDQICHKATFVAADGVPQNMATAMQHRAHANWLADTCQ